RRRHTRWPRDWSSDVCSSDLVDITESDEVMAFSGDRINITAALAADADAGHVDLLVGGDSFCSPQHTGRDDLEHGHAHAGATERSEERRVGKECRPQWWPDEN